MSTNQAADNAEKNQLPQEEPVNLDHLTRSVFARANWGQRALSPWVQRQLQTPARSETTPGVDGHVSAQVTLTTAHTASLLNRLQRTTDKSAVWRPDVGSLNPLMVNRFTESIVERFADTGHQYETQLVQTKPAEPADLTLAGIGQETETLSEEEKIAPALPFTMEEVRRALKENRSGSPQPSPASGETPPPVQRKAIPPKPDPALPFSMDEVRAALEQPHFTKTPSSPPPRPPANLQRRSEEHTSETPVTL